MRSEPNRHIEPSSTHVSLRSGRLSSRCLSISRWIQDVSVVGFDDIDVAGRYIPALTTIHQPRRAVGSQAAGHLLSLMNGEMPEERHSRLDPWLVVRDSTAPPSAAMPEGPSSTS